MTRTTSEQVNKIAAFTKNLTLTGYMEIAEIWVDKIANKDPKIKFPILEMIERYLTAHFARLDNPEKSSKSIAGSATSFNYRGGDGLNLRSTPYGEQAVALDPTGILTDTGKEAGAIYFVGDDDD